MTALTSSFRHETKMSIRMSSMKTRLRKRPSRTAWQRLSKGMAWMAISGHSNNHQPDGSWCTLLLFLAESGLANRRANG